MFIFCRYFYVYDDNSNQNEQLNPVISVDAFLPWQSKPQPQDQYYPMGNKNDVKKRGRCIILNYEKFIDRSKTRNGTEHDVLALKNTFEALNFEVIIHRDMTRKGTLNILDNG